MSATIINLDEERGRCLRSQEPASPPPTVPSKLDWKVSQRGNPYAVVTEAFHVVLFRRSGAWAFRIEDLETGQAWFSERRYGTENTARSDALLAVSQLQRKTPERKA
jgi:hypothetical protein